MYSTPLLNILSKPEHQTILPLCIDFKFSASNQLPKYFFRIWGSHTELSYTPVKEISSVVKELNLSYHKGTTQLIPWRKEQLKQIWRMLDVSFPRQISR